MQCPFTMGAKVTCWGFSFWVLNVLRQTVGLVYRSKISRAAHPSNRRAKQSCILIPAQYWTRINCRAVFTWQLAISGGWRSCVFNWYTTCISWATAGLHVVCSAETLSCGTLPWALDHRGWFVRNHCKNHFMPGRSKRCRMTTALTNSTVSAGRGWSRLCMHY